MKLGIYQHYKGRQYQVLTIARHSETLEEMVVYQCLYENDLGKIWVRPKKMFEEKIISGDAEIERFKFIQES